jgi:flagellar motility protein MotE (MotC chaperone)
MKPPAYVLFTFLIILKLILVSVYLFSSGPVPLFLSSNAIASEKTAATDIKTDTKISRPQAVLQKSPETERDIKTGELSMLLQKKAELKAQEEELSAIRDELNGKIEQLTRLRNEIRADLAKKDEVEGQKLKQLVKVYSSIKPQKAAELIEKLDRNFAVDLLSQMKGESVGAILSFLDKEKGARIIEGLGGRDQAYVSTKDPFSQR